MKKIFSEKNLIKERELEILIKFLMEIYSRKGLTDEILELSTFIDKLLIANKNIHLKAN